MFHFYQFNFRNSYQINLKVDVSVYLYAWNVQQGSYYESFFLGKLIKIPNYIKLSLLEAIHGWKEVDIFDSIIH